MKDLDRFAITEAVLDRIAGTPDPRLKRILESAVRHLHDFAREVELTPEEWLAGIAFVTAVGQACTPRRQEFILLSDVLGLSRLVNVMHDARSRAEGATATSLLGPFFREDAPEVPLGGSLAARPESAGGKEILLFGRVTDAAGAPVPGATMDLWQADAAGRYDLQAEDPATVDMRGRLRCDAEGRYHLRTVKPLGYSVPMGGPVGRLVRQQGRHGHRPAHIHVLVTAPGYQDLVTALYFADDPHIASDTVFGVSDSLIVSERTGLPDSPRPDLPAVRYDFRLSPLAAGTTSGRVGADPSRLAVAAAAQGSPAG
ncbi:6-chlorohydroxyquinol-1,2-dioxygenase [Caldovatus sediminis]|uniref:6-chlorohydroxyquinol-1,2-dioxygenase n=1 Tax=Caldovatus sediminis TaxID=2041189 RepID=A0A8J2ZCP2_9PROT|nr:dioxygenase [Caldovatus sediminis]GGG37952.1 6-chlorohydroxyquinol-1,2-dioxygenase [Caldovatus sediminis]